MKINPSESCALVGESGCGKSTLLDILMGLLTPTKGKLLIDGHQIYKIV